MRVNHANDISQLTCWYRVWATAIQTALFKRRGGIPTCCLFLKERVRTASVRRRVFVHWLVDDPVDLFRRFHSDFSLRKQGFIFVWYWYLLQTRTDSEAMTSLITLDISIEPALAKVKDAVRYINNFEEIEPTCHLFSFANTICFTNDEWDILATVLAMKVQ